MQSWSTTYNMASNYRIGSNVPLERQWATIVGFHMRNFLASSGEIVSNQYVLNNKIREPVNHRLRWVGHVCRRCDYLVRKDRLCEELARETQLRDMQNLRFEDDVKKDLKAFESPHPIKKP